MVTQDVLSLEARKRTWPLVRETMRRDLYYVGRYLSLNNGLLLAGRRRAHNEPGRARASHEVLRDVMRSVMDYCENGDSEALERHLGEAVRSLEVHDWEDNWIERAAAHEGLAEACVVKGSLSRARAAAQVASDEYGRQLNLTSGEPSVARDEFMTRIGSIQCLLGYACCLEGDHAEALVHVGAGVALLNSLAKRDYPALEARLVWALEVYAEVLERTGEYGEAKCVVERIIRIRRAQLQAIAGPIEAALTASNSRLARVYKLMDEAEMR